MATNTPPTFPTLAPDELYALTVIQPWAWTVAYGGKTTINRNQDTDHRGPLAIHAATSERWDRFAQFDGRVDRAWRLRSRRGQFTGDPTSALYPECGQIVYRAVLAVTVLTDCHRATDRCCPGWGDPNAWHLVVKNTVALPDPVPCREPRQGHPGLTWKPPLEVAALVVEQLHTITRPVPGADR